MNRRKFLTVGAAGFGVLAGCRGNSESPPEARTSTEQPSPTDTQTVRETPADTETASRPTPDLTCDSEQPATPEATVTDWIRITTDATSISTIVGTIADPASDLRPDQHDIFTRSRTTDTTVRTTLGGKLFPEYIFVKDEDQYYRIEETLQNSRTITVHEFSIEQLAANRHPDRIEMARQEAIPFAKLPAVDRQVFTDGLPSDAPIEGGTVSSGAAHSYESPTSQENSTFLATEQTYVAYEDHYFSVTFEGTEDATERTFTYRTTVVADTEAEFRDIVTDVFVATPATLDISTATRTLLDHIVSCGHYQETEPLSAEIQDLWAAFEEGPSKPGVSFIYYLRHGSHYYRLSLRRQG